MYRFNFIKYWILFYVVSSTSLLFGTDYQDSVDAHIYTNKEKAVAFNLYLKDASPAKYFNNLGLLKEFNEELDSAIYYYQKSLSQKDIGQLTTIKDYNYLGILHSNIGDYTASLEFYLKALDVASQLNDSTQLFNITNNIGVMYFNKNNLLYAKKHYKESLNIAIGINNKDKIASVSKNIADVLVEEKKYTAAIKEYISVLKMLEKSDYSDLKLNTLNSLGLTYRMNKEYGKAQSQFHKALQIARQRNQTFYHNSIYLNLGKIAFEKKRNNECLEYFHLADSCLKYNPNPNLKAELLLAYAEFYYKNGNIDSVYHYQTEYNQLQADIYEKSNAEKVEYFEGKFEKEKKDKTILLLSKNNEILDQEKETAKAKASKYRIFVFALIGTSILLGLLFIVFLYSVKQRKRKVLLNYQKRELQKDNEIKQLMSAAKMDRIKSELDGEEKERERIAADLHDGVGSALAGIIMKLDQDDDQELTNELKEVYQEIRIISHHLTSPNSFEDNSFLLLIKSLLKKYLIVHNIKASLVWFPEDQKLILDKSKELALLRIFQEVFTNITKHSNANDVVVQFYFEEKQVEISIEDNGIGYAVNKSKNGIGLKNIKKRVSYLKGTLKIESNSNGTSIFIKLPL